MMSEAELKINEKPMRISNADYVYPNYFYAGFWVRFIAFMIDLLIINALQTIFIDFPTNFFVFLVNKDQSVLYFLLSTGIFLSYFVFMTKFTGGQTIGKMIMGLRVVSIGEKNLRWGTVIVRECFGRFILKVIPLLYLTMIFNRDKQQLADIFCDTSVISEKILFASEDAFIRRRIPPESLQ